MENCRKDIDKISLKNDNYSIRKLFLTYQSNYFHLIFFLFNCHLISLATSHSGLNEHLGFIFSKLLYLTPTEMRHQIKFATTLSDVLLLAKAPGKADTKSKLCLVWDSFYENIN